MPEEKPKLDRISISQEDEPEPWESWETKLVAYSIGIGIVVLIIGGLLINHYLL